MGEFLPNGTWHEEEEGAHEPEIVPSSELTAAWIFLALAAGAFVFDLYMGARIVNMIALKATGIDRSKIDEVEEDDVYAAQLEAELATTEMAQSFDRPTDDDDAPVDVDFNLVKNLLESVEAQDGAGPGAAALLLNELGLELPADDD